jgi:hypothetical protein
MHYIIQASAFSVLWSSLDRGEDGWTSAQKQEFESDLLNALQGGNLRSVSRLGLEISPNYEQPLQDRYVTLEDCIGWMRRSSFQGQPKDEFELAYMLGLDVIINKCMHQEPQTRVLPHSLNALINGDELEFSVEQKLTPRTVEFEKKSEEIREIFNSPDWPLRVNSEEYLDFLNLTPAFAIQMKIAKPQMAIEQEFNADLLATPHELIRAFGLYTGIDKKWFRDISSKSKSFQASRKRKGTHGRNAVQPLFCPYEFMKASLEHRGKGRRVMSETTAWKALRHHFEDVFAQHIGEAPPELE